MVAVSLELKDKEVRAYKTDPVQVRLCSHGSAFSYKSPCVLVSISDAGPSHVLCCTQVLPFAAL